jgi:hypothetical protein
VVLGDNACYLRFFSVIARGKATKQSMLRHSGMVR